MTPSIFAKPIESQPAEITQLFFSQPLSLTLANLGSSWESGILQGKWIRREFCHCLGFAETVKKLTRPIFDASNDR